MNPYFRNENKYEISSNISSLLNKNNYLDIVSVIKILNKGFAFSDRTLVDHIHMTPWMAKPNDDCTLWNFDKIPSHNSMLKDSKIIAKELYKKLKLEIRNYIGKKTNIGILLSGGMDSRIVSVILNDLIKDGLPLKVTAITWGVQNSRDVIYAQRIAKLLKWDWKYFELSSNTLLQNIEIAAREGALYSPIHLHAMNEVSKLKDIDCIIAGSFGDSVGRAEYSGTHVLNLKTLNSSIFNRFKILNENIYAKYSEHVKKDISYYNNIFSKNQYYQQCEVEQELHYMRKLLNPCMNVINKKIPLFQAFSSPDVFGYMWSLSPKVRTDKIYFDLLSEYSLDLLEIPWARTGQRYLSADNQKIDKYLKDYHSYGLWIRKDIYTIIKAKVISPYIENLGIFNMKSIKNLFLLNSFSKQSKHTKIDEILIWLATLSDYIRINNITTNMDKKSNIKDIVNGYITSIVHYVAFDLKLKIHKGFK